MEIWNINLKFCYENWISTGVEWGLKLKNIMKYYGGATILDIELYYSRRLLTYWVKWTISDNTIQSTKGKAPLFVILLN